MRIATQNSAATIVALGLLLAGCTKKPTPLDQSPVSNQLKHFIAEKKAQATAAAAARGHEMLPEFKTIFAAAEKGNWLTISNVFVDLRGLEAKYGDGRTATTPKESSISNAVADLRSGMRGDEAKSERLHGTEWEAVKEIWGAFGCLASDVPQDKYSVALGQEIIRSIPPGSIYFGGSDPGRWTVTALEKSQVNGDPFFTLTQNALVDPGYLEYLRGMYGAKIYVPTTNELNQCFSNYMEDTEQRLHHDQNFPKEPRQMKPGEDIMVDSTNGFQARGQVAVMGINALMAKLIFDHETNREFYVEESFPLDWMYPHLKPHGLIMKLNREPLKELPDELIREDREFWSARVAQVLGDWLTYDTSVSDICAFERKVYLKHDFGGFNGDRRFVSDDWPHWMSSMRSAIAGIYMWRAGINPSGGVVPPEQVAKGADRERMIREADFACRQAFALAPDTPQSVYRYVDFLVNQNPSRLADAIAVAEVGCEIHKSHQDFDQFQYLLKNLRDIQSRTSKNPAAN